MIKDKIVVRGARSNNLKNIDVEIPRNKMVIFTGISGSGKSSLAFDTIFAEGQRRYIESLSSYARQFLGQMEKPDVDLIDGLSPAISIDQKTTSRNPRSTVGTITEIYDYFRLLFARVGIPHCPVCGVEIKQQTIDQIVDRILAYPENTRIQILSPVIRGRKGEYLKLFDDLKKSGYVRVRVDGITYDLEEEIPLDKNKKHDIAVVVDRLSIREGVRKRLTDSCETALKLAKGILIVYRHDTEQDQLFSQRYSCPDHDIGVEELSPRLFSFNNPTGACKECSGLGIITSIDPSNLIVDDNLSIVEDGINAPGFGKVTASPQLMKIYSVILKKYGNLISDPINKVDPKAINEIMFGNDGFDGIIPTIERRYKQSTSDFAKAQIEALMTSQPCKACQGQRLNPIARNVTVGGKSITQICDMSVSAIYSFLEQLEFNGGEAIIASQILKEIKNRLNFLMNVGLRYLTLSRSANTLSGGEAQRIRLATQIGSSLLGVIYILDEPSIGLHQKDNIKLINALKNLRDIGNTLIVVEHDEETIRSGDYIVDIGPGAGVHGGEVVACGTIDDIMASPRSITGDYLAGRKIIPVPQKIRKTGKEWIVIKGAKENNLKDIEVKIPLKVFTSITGVSGSGKSSLINEILYKHLASVLNRAKTMPGRFDEITGTEYLDKVVNIDQSPIGKSPRSNPATYTGMFNDIRDLFSKTAEAKARGYTAGRFSFNVQGGRCEACSGDGIVKIEMHFLPDIYVPCDVCGGKKYNRETLEVKFKDKNIYEILEMTVEESLKFFENIPSIYKKVRTLFDVGLGYLKIGQPSTTLSGGEAQRVKLATELSRPATGRTVYILDEPTTGLHSDDVNRLIRVLQQLVDKGNTVIVIEHNLDVIKSSDYIIDLGPEGGDEGGEVVVAGTPEEVIACDRSYTGQYLKDVYKK